MRCNICGGTRFLDMPKRPSVRCAACGSLERTRVAALHLARLALAPGARILHFAPERGLSQMLRAAGGAGYRAVDIDPARYPGLGVEAFDLCRDVFDLPRDHYDLIVHNHVLEHIECNYTVVLVRLAQALTATGTMLFSVPLLPGLFTDELIDLPLDAKRARFGDMLHVRRFGTDFLQQTLGMIFPIPDRYDLLASFSAAELQEANIPRHHWTQFTGASIFRVRRGDLKV
jgi:hypothetical protein